jgi:hypothetical protein
MLDKISLFIYFNIIIGAFGRKTYYCDQVEQNCYFRSVIVEKDEHVVLKVKENVTNIFKETDVKYVTFENSSLYQIPHEIFDTFPTIDKLELVQQNVLKCSKSSFSKAKNLKRLEFSKHKIGCIGRDIFTGEFFKYFLATQTNYHLIY